jgi:hypothetical protein
LNCYAVRNLIQLFHLSQIRQVTQISTHAI